MGDHDELDDRDLSLILRRQADELTGPIDTDIALHAVQQRIRNRRRWRAVTSTIAATAAVTVTIVAAGVALDADRTTLRTPTAPTDVPVTIPAPPATTANTATPVAPSATVTTVPATSTTAPLTQTAPAPTQSTPTPTITAMAPPAPPASSTSTFSSIGGSIVVRIDAGAIALDGPPSPSSGWSYRVEDNGPDRVRVRFERDGGRSEIRVDLEGGQLIPQITEQ
jgi:hypothetical protein